MYAIVDLETTGGQAQNNRIIEIAIVHHDGIRVTGQYCMLINPDCEIPSFIRSLTGISDNMVKDSPRFEEVAEEVGRWLENRIFVAHNAKFDYEFLKKEFGAIGINWSAKKLCTIWLGRKIIPGLASYSLGRFAQTVGIEIQGRHRAGGDALATAKIFDLLLQQDNKGLIEEQLCQYNTATHLVTSEI